MNDSTFWSNPWDSFSSWLGNLFSSNSQYNNPELQKALGQYRLDFLNKNGYYPSEKQQTAFSNNWLNQNNSGGGLFSNFSWDDIASGIQALGSVGNAYMAGKQLDLARDQFNFNKQAWASNFANSVKNYNTLLKDKIQARAYQETGDINAYNDRYEQNKL